MSFHAQHIRAAQVHLKRKDPVLRRLIRDVGPFTLRAERRHFEMLVRSIVSQQISTAAARTILSRLVVALEPDGYSPQRIAALSVEQLREIGISRQKAGYVLDLASRVAAGEINFRSLVRADDETVIGKLTEVKGIGVWTAQMFLMFSLGRMDVLPVGDLGIRKAIQNQWNLAELPAPAEIETIARPWRPYATIACWYLWRSLDLPAKGE